MGPWSHFIKIIMNRELHERDGGEGGEKGGRDYKKAKVSRSKSILPINKRHIMTVCGTCEEESELPKETPKKISDRIEVTNM